MGFKCKLERRTLGSRARLLVGVLVFLALPISTASARSTAKTVSSPSQTDQQRLNDAIAALTAMGFDFTGIEVVVGKLPKGAIGYTHPDKKKIEVSLVNLDGVVGGAPEDPGHDSLEIDLVHELKHAKEGYGGDAASEAALIADVAAWNCERVCVMQAAGKVTTAFCAFYKAVMNSYNTGKLRDNFVKAGISPPIMPPCECCPP